MLSKIIRSVATLFGMLLGAVLANQLVGQSWLPELLHRDMTQSVVIAVYVFIILLFGIIIYLIFPVLHRNIKKLSVMISQSLDNVRVADIVLACCGLVIGLLIALLISFAISLIPIPWLSSLLTVIVYILLGYLGFTIALNKRDDILNLFQRNVKEKEPVQVKKPRKKNVAQGKLLDTSVIIDGRIYDLISSGFLEGQLIVPTFVLTELQLLADSADDMKRSRGRRGLEMLQRIQTDHKESITISDTDYRDLTDVDAKLIQYAKTKKLAIITNDYNLNQVATVQGIAVLNIHELAEALKPVLLPGETVALTPVKSGKEAGQAVAYLDDGTMVVVENGRKSIGESISVIVTSILQTSAGRMIFARPCNEYGK